MASLTITPDDATDNRPADERDAPPRGTNDPKRLRKWIDSGIMYTHEYRMRQFRNWRRADFFDQNKGWLTDSYNSDPTRTMHLAQIHFRKHTPNAIPLPNLNEFSASHENEAARLGKPEYQPYVRPEGETPDLEVRTGAKVAEASLKQTLKDMRWDEEMGRGLYHMPFYGGWWTWSYFDWSWEDTVRIPVETALQCPQCDYRLASPEIPAEPGADDQAPQQVTHCPNCDTHQEMGLYTPGDGPIGVGQDDTYGLPPNAVGQTADVLDGEPEPPEPSQPPQQVFGSHAAPGPPKLQPFEPGKQLLTPDPSRPETVDVMGRSFGEDAKKGNWKLRTLDPRDVFPSNLGVGVTPESMDEWWLCHVEQLSWVRNRFDNGGLVKAERPEALMEFHPVAGERALYEAATGAPGMRLFKQHVRVKEYHRKPRMMPVTDAQGKPVMGPDGKTPKLAKDRGRSIVMAGNVILFDGDFLIESRLRPGTFIPRCHLDYAPWKLRSGGAELHGISMGESIFDACEMVMQAWSQIEDCRRRKGSPKWLVTRGMDFDYVPGKRAGGLYVYDPDPEHPEKAPTDVDNDLLNSAIYKEIESLINYIVRATHLNDVESGNVPQGVTAALALQLLAEQSSVHRTERIRRIRTMLERCYTHGLQLMHELCLPEDGRVYADEIGTDQFRDHAWDGLKFVGQTRVRIDAEPDHDTALVKQQVLSDYLAKNPKALDDQRTSRIIAKELGVPEEIFQKANLQENAAEREYLDFLEQQRQPYVDSQLDDDDLHHERHGIDMMSERWREQEDETDWHNAQVWLADWETKFNDQPGAPQPITLPNGQTTMGPAVPVSGLNSQAGQSWPPQLELRIFKAWQVILGQAIQQGFYQPPPAPGALPSLPMPSGMSGAPAPLPAAAPMAAGMPGTAPAAPMAPPPPPPLDPKLLAVMRFRAHDEAHRIRATQKKTAAAAGQQIVAAPGGDETAAGTVPTAGQPEAGAAPPMAPPQQGG